MAYVARDPNRTSYGAAPSYTPRGGGGGTPAAPTIESIDNSTPGQLAVSVTAAELYSDGLLQCYLDAGLTNLHGNLGLGGPGGGTPEVQIFTGLLIDTEYWFRAKVTVGGVDSAWSATVSATTANPLAGTFALVTHNGDSVPLGLYKTAPAMAASATLLFPNLATVTEQVLSVTLDAFPLVNYSFGLIDPGDGSVYVGIAIGDAATDGAAFVSAVNSNQGTQGVATIDPSNNVTVTSNTTGSASFVLLAFPIMVQAGSGTDPVTTPATADGDAISEWHDVLGGSGLMATQYNTMFQPILRFSNGKPYLDCAAGYLIFPDLSANTEGEMSLLYYLPKSSINGNLVYKFGAAEGGGTYLPLDSDGTIYDAFGCAVNRMDAINAGGLLHAQTWQVYNVSASQDGTWRNSVDGTEILSTNNGGTGFLAASTLGKYSDGSGDSNVQLIGCVFGPVDATKRAAIGTYLNSLKP